MLKVNNSRPDEIIINQSDVKGVVVNHGENSTAVWGKAYSMEFHATQGMGIKAERISSPYEGASTGAFNSFSNTVYYGDVIRFSAVNIQSGYHFDYFEINGSVYTSNPTEITCTGNILNNPKSHADYVASWHTVFSGNLETSHQTSTSASTYIYTVSGLTVGYPTRITGYLYKESNQVVLPFTGSSLPVNIIYGSKTQSILSLDMDNKLKITLQRPTPLNTYPAPYFVITKIEQYY